MKKSKYLLATILIPVMFLLIGELYAVYLINAEFKFASTEIFFMEGEEASPKIQKTISVADKNNIEIFIINEQSSDDILTVKTIYSSKNVKNMLLDEINLPERTIKSLFFGNTKIEYKEIKDFEIMNNKVGIFLVGSQENISNFHNDFKEFSGEFFSGQKGNSYKLYICELWIAVFILLILLTFFEISLSKKENCVKIFLGENPKSIIARNILLDLCVYVIIFLVTLIITNFFTNTLYNIKISLGMFVIFLTINSLAFFTYLLVDVKKSIFSKKAGKITLKICYIYKFVSVLACVVVLVFCCGSVKNLINLTRHNSFFENLKSYDLLMTAPLKDRSKSNDDQAFDRFMELIEKTASDEYFVALENTNTQSYVNLGVQNEYSGTEWIFCDAGAKDYIQENIKKYKDYDFEEKVYIIAPKKFLRKYGYERVVYLYSGYDKGNWYQSYQQLDYSSNTEFISFSYFDELTVEFEKNPVVIFDNRKASQIDSQHDIYLCRASFMQVSDSQWNDIVNRGTFNLNRTFKSNAYEFYQHELAKATKIGIFSIFLACVILLIETLIIKSLIQYEFTIYGMELVLKKLLGYSFAQKYKKLIKITLISELLILIILTIYYLFSPSLPYVFLSVGVFLIIDFIVIFSYVNKMERINLQKVLKGALI